MDFTLGPLGNTSQQTPSLDPSQWINLRRLPKDERQHRQKTSQTACSLPASQPAGQLATQTAS